MENIYLFEILVNSFTLEPLEPFPERDSVKVNVKFCTFDLEIDPTGAEDWPDDTGDELMYNLGKSLIFPSRPSKLMQQSQIPIKVSVSDQYRQLGQTKIPWFYFDKMIGNSQITEPCKIEGVFSLIIKDVIKGTINLFIRLSVFGRYIESKFYIKQDLYSNQTDYCFKNPNNSKTVVCKKVMSEDCPISTKIFNKSRLNKEFEANKDNLSWEALFKTNLEGRFSMTNPEFGKFISAVSAVSMMNMGEKPNEKKVKEICEIIQKVIFDLDKEENPDIEVLTLEKIQESLCGNEDCKWVKKFAEMGIACGKHKYVKPTDGPNDQPRDYGITKSFGMFGLHGPESKYRRPKRINDPFFRIKKC